MRDIDNRIWAFDGCKYKSSNISNINGRLAQLVAHLNDIQRVTSSSLVTPTIYIKRNTILTTTELTNEEIVTRLLTANQIINKDDVNSFVSNPVAVSASANLGDFLKSKADNNTTINRGKYTFINLNSGWAW